MKRQNLAADDLAAIRAWAQRLGKSAAREAFGPQGPGLDVDLTAMEEVARAAAEGITQGTVECLLQQQAEQLPVAASCPTCGRSCPTRREPRRVTIRGATIEHHEPVAHCPACRRDFFPSAAVAASR